MAGGLQYMAGVSAGAMLAAVAEMCVNTMLCMASFEPGHVVFCGTINDQMATYTSSRAQASLSSTIPHGTGPCA